MARYMTKTQTLTHGGQTLQVVWERKAVKNFNLRVRRDGSVYLSTPQRVSEAQAERFLREKWAFVLDARARMAARALPTALTLTDGEALPVFGVTHTVLTERAARTHVYCAESVLHLALPHPEDAAARIRAFWRFAAEEVLTLMRALTAELAPCFLPEDAPLPEVTQRRMKGRWGSCFYTKGRINYSTNLIFVPKDCARYVACHELAHFRHPDHSAAFYACLARVLPQHKELRRILHATPIPEFEEQ